MAEQSQPAAQLPRPRSYESEESFQRRLQRYQIWNKYREQHPDIDLNTAVRLEETGWTLEQLRATQKQRRQRYLSRKKQYTRARQEKNQTFSGTQYMETVISEQVGLWSFGSDATEWVGYLLQNDLYRWHVRDESGERRVFHKLQLGCVCELEQRSAIWELCRLEEQQRASGEVPSELPHERFHIPDELLLRSLEQEQPMAFQLFCGLWFWGWVYWYDPYQLSLVLNVDEQEDELVEVMVFRHSIKSIAPELPTSWNNLPTLAWHRQTTTQP